MGNEILKNYFNVQAEAQNYTLAQAEAQYAKATQAEAGRMQTISDTKAERSAFVTEKADAPTKNEGIAEAMAEAKLAGKEYDGPPLVSVEALDQKIAVLDKVLEKLAIKQTGIDNPQNALNVLRIKQSGAFKSEIERLGFPSDPSVRITRALLGDMTINQLAVIADLASAAWGRRVTVAELLQSLDELDAKESKQVRERALENARKGGGGDGRK